MSRAKLSRRQKLEEGRAFNMKSQDVQELLLSSSQRNLDESLSEGATEIKLQLKQMGLPPNLSPIRSVIFDFLHLTPRI